MTASTFTLPASRAGVGSAVVTETDTKTYPVANVGVVTESGTPGGGGTPTQTVFVMALT